MSHVPKNSQRDEKKCQNKSTNHFGCLCDHSHTQCCFLPLSTDFLRQSLPSTYCCCMYEYYAKYYTYGTVRRVQYVSLLSQGGRFMGSLFWGGGC